MSDPQDLGSVANIGSTPSSSTHLSRQSDNATSDGGGSTLPSEASVSPSEATGDPEALRAAAQQVRTDAAHQAAQIMADAEQAAEELTHQAETAEAMTAEHARQHAYLSKVEQVVGDLTVAKAGYDAAVVKVTEAENLLADKRDRHHQAEVRVNAAHAKLANLVRNDAALDELEEARLAVASAESLVPMLAPAVEDAEARLAQAVRRQEVAKNDVEVAWRELGRLQAQEGLGRPECLGPPPPPCWAEMTHEERVDAFVNAYQRECERSNSPAMQLYREAQQREKQRRLDLQTRRAMAAVLGQQ